MSRFKPSPQLQVAEATASLIPSPAAIQSPAATLAPISLPATPTQYTSPLVRANVVATIGFILYCTYQISALANEWTLRAFKTSTGIPGITLLLLPAAWIFTRGRLQSLKYGIGRFWVIFLLCLFVDVPFSVWRGGSAILLSSYIRRSYVSFFYISTFVTSVRRCRSLMLVNIACAALTIIYCYSFGSDSDGRFSIPNSPFFANANDLAVQLLLGITQFAFLFYERGMVKKGFGALGILLSCMYLLRTGSRGTVLAGVCYVGVFFFLARDKVRFLVCAMFIVILGAAVSPSAPLHRLMLSLSDKEAQSSEDWSAIGSAMQRKELLKRSVVETLRHPFFGVGPGQFAVAVAGEKAAKGEWADWLGTHNSYTQISSECGIPAFICYVSLILLCFRMNYQLLKAARANPHGSEGVYGLALTLFSGILVYSVSTIFFHTAYSSRLPILTGETLALYISARHLLHTENSQNSAESV